MEWLDAHAPTIQALAAVGIFLLTGALVWATWKYARLVEEELAIIRQQSVRQRPSVIFELQASGWELQARCRNVGEPSLVLNSVRVELSAIETSHIVSS